MADLQARVPALLERLNAQPALAAAAAVNPLLALSALGVEVTSRLAIEIEDRCRFSTKQIALRRRLRDQIARKVGQSIDPGSESDVRRLLLEHLDLGRRGRETETQVPRPRHPGGPITEDPLVRLEGAHAVIPLLLKYRALEAAAPGFGSRDLFERVKQGKLGFPVKKLRFRLSKQRRRGRR